MRAYLSALALVSGLMVLWAAIIGIQTAGAGLQVWTIAG
jgi:hypothetical protein